MSLLEFGFELNRRLISDRGVKSLAIVVFLDERSDVVPSFFYASIVLSIYLLNFESLNEAFGFGIVIGISWSASADLRATVWETFDVVGASVLDPAIRMMDEIGQCPRADQHEPTS